MRRWLALRAEVFGRFDNSDALIISCLFAVCGDRQYKIINKYNKLYKVAYDEILYCQSMGDFVKIHTKEKSG